MTGGAGAALGFAAAVLAALLDGTATVMLATASQRTGSPWLGRGLRYAAGLTVDLLGWGLTVFALRFLPVFAVQSLVATQTAFAVLLGHAVLRSALRGADLLGIATTALGLGLVAAGATRDTGWTAPPPVVLVVLLALLVSVLAGAAAAVRWGTVARSVLAGCAYGGAVLAIRALMRDPGATSSVDALLGQPLTFVTIAFAIVGVALYATALRRGTPAVPSAIVTMTEVFFPGSLAILLLGDRVRPGWWGWSGAGLVIAVAGVTVLVLRQADRTGD
ncbi:hypothetical protein [Amycolatopsis sp. NPDC003861]